MKVNKVFQFKRMSFLWVLVLAGGLILGINGGAMGGLGDPPPGSQRIPNGNANAAGCYVPDDDKMPVTGGKLPPCATGVPTAGTPTQWKCPGLGDSPNQTCHWAFENRLGCENGGAGMMCDTVAVGGGGTECSCVSP